MNLDGLTALQLRAVKADSKDRIIIALPVRLDVCNVTQDAASLGITAPLEVRATCVVLMTTVSPILADLESSFSTSSPETGRISAAASAEPVAET